jgi:TRAP-type C4-dicarboxylate transport system permease small subunit
MSEPEKPKRSWLRFHLATAVVIVFITGTFLGLSIIDPRTGREYAMLGFPYIALFPPSSWRNNYQPGTGWEVMSWPGLVTDLTILAICLFTGAIVSEGLARRHPAPSTLTKALVAVLFCLIWIFAFQRPLFNNPLAW